jgi:hypothetical protein
MFTGNPHQDQRNLDRRGHKSFTSGWRDGWNDLKNDNIRDWQGPMNPGGQLPRPNPWNGKPFPKGQDVTYTPMTAGVDFGNRRPMYDKNGKLIKQRPVLKDTSTVPVPIMDYVGSRTAMNRGMDNWKNYGGYLGGTFDQDGYGDPSSKNPWGGYQEPEYNYDGYDDDVLDPGFNTSYALGPLYFG